MVMPSFALRASEKSCRSSPSLFELRRNLAEVLLRSSSFGEILPKPWRRQTLAKADLGESRPWRRQTLAKADLSEGRP
jgi:hypothetical protein